MIDDLTNVEANRSHYSAGNGRVPGWQITVAKGVLDARQCAILREIPTGSTVLDLGCADGSFLILARAAGTIGCGHGVDLWAEGIAWGNHYCATIGYDVRLICMDIAGYLWAPVDVVVLGEVLEHAPSPVVLLNTAANHLLPGGRCIITVPVSRPPYTPDELLRLQHEPDEHIHQYGADGHQLRKQCLEAGLRVTKAFLLGQGWVNLIAVAEPI